LGFLDEENKTRGPGLVLNPVIKQIKIPDENTYRTILNDMVLAFYKLKRKGCETQGSTEEYCRRILNTCMTGFKPDGSIWKNMPGGNTNDWFESLAQRLRIYQYDLITKSIVGKKSKTVSEKIKEAADFNQKASGDDFIPTPLTGTLSLGETVELEDFKKKFVEDFPTSVTVVDMAMIDRLGLLIIMSKRDTQTFMLTDNLTKEIKDLSEALGVTGKQRMTQLSSEKNGTLELLSLKYKKTLDEYIDIEKEWKMEELKMVSNAVHRGTLPDFLAMSWIKILYGKEIDGEPASIESLDKFLIKNGVVLND